MSLAPKSPGVPISRIYGVASNARLQDLCGPNHRHLALIEAELAGDGLSRLESQGGGILIMGLAEAVAMAEAALAEFERRLKAGAEANEMELKGALEAARAAAQAGAPGSFATLKGLKRPVSPQSQGQARYLDALTQPENGLVFGVGPAGTGKTYLAVAVAVSELLQGVRTRLVVTRPAVEAGERLGFLPGTLEEKVDPYMLPIWDSLRELLGQEQMERRMARAEIEVAPLAFMRGRTLKQAFVIVDEAQNTTSAQMKMVLTRLGRDSRMVVTGDPGQVDLPRGQTSGLSEALSVLDGVEGVTRVDLSARDVVRHALVSRIIEAYDSAGGAR